MGRPGTLEALISERIRSRACTGESAGTVAARPEPVGYAASVVVTVRVLSPKLAMRSSRPPSALM